MTPTNLSKLTERYELVLGSGSPRRQRLLDRLGIKYRVVVPTIDEIRLEGEAPFNYARRMAEGKALQISSRCNNEIVLGCDTIVVLDNVVLQKPTDEANAVEMLSSLAGRAHIVCSALALALGGRLLRSGHELSTVHFKAVSRDEILDYVASGEPMDKAGAYGIQGIGAFLVDRVEGSVDNVIGLPSALLEKFAGEVLLEI
ncbi:MAG: septum formation protein Maf [Candidatus Zixiibacteriota bacterium]|nr:MAG: septum formation protein Maf [candidate division Zixibacteria bacterium]